MQFTKPPKTFDEQVDLLMSRGMEVGDLERAKRYLAHLNYYRLAAYWLPFEQDHPTHRFKTGTRFETILELYIFDRELRLLVMDAIERIEVSLRTRWAYHLAHTYGPHAHLNAAIHKGSWPHRAYIDALKAVVKKSSEVKKTVWREEKPGAREIWDEYLRLRATHGTDDKKIENEIQFWFQNLPKNHPSKKWARYRRIDGNGPWRDRDISWPGGDGPTYDVIHPKTGKPCKVPERGWIYASPDEMQRQIRLGLVEFRADHTEPPFRKAHIRPATEELGENEEVDDADNGEEELATQVRGSYFYKQSQVSVKYLRKLMGAKIFDNPKDHEELAKLLKYMLGASTEEVIIDFFGGSGSTAEAVLQLNNDQGTNHKFILVQLPEPCNPKEKSGKTALSLGYQTIADIGKERIRRAGKKIKAEQGDKAQDLDTGFRVFKLDTSNLKDVYYTPDALQQKQLDLFADHIKPDRRPEDLLFQVFLDWGLDLTLPIAKETIDGKTVFLVAGNALLACFDPGITEELVKKLAIRKPLRAVFRDDAFGSDSVKINVEQIFKLLSPVTEVKSI